MFEDLVADHTVEAVALDGNVGQITDVRERGVLLVELREISGLVVRVREQMPVWAATGAGVEHGPLGGHVCRGAHPHL